MASTNTPIRLIVGLGNPGDQYRGTRHNMGFLFLDRLVQQQKDGRFSSDARFFGDTARICTSCGDLWLLKPTTFMNLSGSAVQAMAAYYKIKPEEILVVHDELDIAPGCLKVKLGGGNAGHNGLKDITAKLFTPNFWRLRVGIGHPRIFCPQQQVYDWVLGTPSQEHLAAINLCIDAALKTVEYWAAGEQIKAERALKKYATPPKPQSASDENAKKA